MVQILQADCKAEICLNNRGKVTHPTYFSPLPSQTGAKIIGTEFLARLLRRLCSLDLSLVRHYYNRFFY